MRSRLFWLVAVAGAIVATSYAIAGHPLTAGVWMCVSLLAMLIQEVRQ